VVGGVGNLILIGYVGCWVAWANWTSICYYNTIIYIYLRLFLYIYIFYFCCLLLYITKASPRLTPYRLKGKKGVGRLTSPCRLIA
jgi:hypothetical protein